MKKFVVLLAVAAFTLFGSMAYAVDVSVSGSIDIRSRDFNDLNLNKDTDALATNAQGNTTTTSQRDTQERIRINVDAKAGNDVKGRISIENNWDTWGRLETPQGNGQSITTDEGIISSSNHPVTLDVREAWISFNLPVVPVNVTGGHQLLMLGNGWWFRSMKYGSDAWVVANVTGNNTAALVNIKASEGFNDQPAGTLGAAINNQTANTARADDLDAYVILDVYKIDENNVVGFDITNIHDRTGIFSPLSNGADLYNYSINYNGKLGPVALKAQLDLQSGDIDTVSGPQPNFKGKEVVIEGKVPIDPVTINFTAAYGSGNQKGDDNVKGYVTLLDADPHYTLLYEYKIKTGAGAAHTGFSNTETLNVGAMYAASPNLAVGLDFWWLHATEAVSLNGAAQDRDLGYEIDAKINWKLYDNLTWNWVLGYFAPGKAYDFAAKSADSATGIQGILSFKF